MDKKEIYELRQQADGDDLFRATAQNKVDTYNQSQAEDDGTGVQCSDCNNHGYIAFLNEDGIFSLRPCKCSGIRLTVTRLRAQGLFEKAREQTLSRFQADTDARKILKSLVKKFIAEQKPWGMILCGQSGTGKTHLCTAAFVRLSLDRGLDGRYMQWLTEARKIKATSKDGDDRILNDFKLCRLLYIDDLFKCKKGSEPSDADVKLAFEILDHRYSHKLPTIISTEMLPEEIRDQDEAIYRRIHEMCYPYIGNVGRDPGKCYMPKGTQGE